MHTLDTIPLMSKIQKFYTFKSFLGTILGKVLRVISWLFRLRIRMNGLKDCRGYD